MRVRNVGYAVGRETWSCLYDANRTQASVGLWPSVAVEKGGLIWEWARNRVALAEMHWKRANGGVRGEEETRRIEAELPAGCVVCLKTS